MKRFLPVYGERRIVKRFAILPTTIFIIEDDCKIPVEIWFESYWDEQEYQPTFCCGGSNWVTIREYLHKP